MIMKNQWMAYAIVALISALAGIAIAGTPNTVGTAPTIVVPETTTTTTLAPEVTTTLPADEDLAVETTTTTDPSETTTASDDDTDVDDSDLDDAEADSENDGDEDADADADVDDDEVDRSTIDVIAANAAATGGLATRVRDELRDLGFTQAQATDGTTTVDDTVVYFADGFAREGAEVAEALGLELSDMAPLDGAPEYGRSDDDQVVVYIGRDRA